MCVVFCGDGSYRKDIAVCVINAGWSGRVLESLQWVLLAN